jgi:DNA-binding NarL/FixJ family response regulator
VILIDFDRAGPSALAAIRRIATSAPRARVVMLFADDDLDLVGALAPGAYACILKDAPMHEILAATRAAAARGEWVVSPPVVRTPVNQIRARSDLMRPSSRGASSKCSTFSLGAGTTAGSPRAWT